MNRKSRLLYLVVSVILGWLTLLLMLYGTLLHPSERWDEQTNISVVKELRLGGPLQLNGEEFFEKPPLWYQLAKVAELINGQELASYRLPGILATFSMILAVIYYGFKQNRPWFGLVFWLALICVPQFWFLNYNGLFSSHTLVSADLDALQLLFLTLASFTLFSFLKNRGNKNLYLSFGFLGLALLTKGPLALLFLGINLALLKGSGTSIKQLFKGFAVFLVVALPWHLYMAITYGPSFWESYLGYHILGRFFSPLEGHAAPWYYPLGIFLDIRYNPLWPLLIYCGYKLLKQREIQGLYLIVLLLLYLLLITLTGTKLAWYLLPAYLLQALIIAQGAMQSNRKGATILLSGRKFSISG